MKPFQPVILMPSYNTGPLLREVVGEVLETPYSLWLVVDGSTDGSHEPVKAAFASRPRFRILESSRNQGKGAVLLEAAREAAQAGYTHILTMDADGQHPVAAIPQLLEAAQSRPEALIMGKPVFGKDVPLSRLHGRKLTNWWTDLETGGCGLGDTLFGMRVYPLKAFLRAFSQTSHARGFDFDPEIAVRLVWLGLEPIQIPVPVRYIPREQGGVSHFHYLRDNLKLTWLHFRLVPEYLFFRYWKGRRQQFRERRPA